MPTNRTRSRSGDPAYQESIAHPYAQSKSNLDMLGWVRTRTRLQSRLRLEALSLGLLYTAQPKAQVRHPRDQVQARAAEASQQVIIQALNTNPFSPRTPAKDWRRTRYLWPGLDAFNCHDQQTDRPIIARSWASTAAPMTTPPDSPYCPWLPLTWRTEPHKSEPFTAAAP